MRGIERGSHKKCTASNSRLLDADRVRKKCGVAVLTQFDEQLLFDAADSDQRIYAVTATLRAGYPSNNLPGRPCPLADPIPTRSALLGATRPHSERRLAQTYMP